MFTNTNTSYQTDGFRPHFELIEMIGGINFEAGRDVFGSRGYFLTGPAVLLNQALISYGIAFLMREGACSQFVFLCFHFTTLCAHGK